jgi:DNA invertase Pin-like site-specific DNA recombinase
MIVKTNYTGRINHMADYAYVRVSTKEQNIDRQIMALEPYKIPRKNIYCDYQSGKNFERPAYQRLLKRLKENDLLIIKSIDRLGRNYNEILVQWQHITKEIKADILVLDMELLDTRKKDGNLTGTLIADLVLQIFAYVAQTERELIRQRQAEGIAAAKAKGKQLGRKPIKMPENFQEACISCEQGALSTREAAQKIGLSHTTFYRNYKEYLSKNTEKTVLNSRHFET